MLYLQKSDIGENNENECKNGNGETTSDETSNDIDASDSQLNTGIDF